MKKMKLSVKLIGGFIVVALITLAVGVSGWWTAKRLGGDIHEIGEVRLPSVESLLVVAENLEKVKVTQRTLLIPNLSAEDRKRQYDNLAAAREHYQKALQTYEALPQTAEEAELWKPFAGALEAWREANNKFFETAKQLETIDVLNPAVLKANLQQFRADHHRLLALAAGSLLTHEPSKEKSDAATCQFGKWLATFTTTNPIISAALVEVKQAHEGFHGAFNETAQLVGSGDAAAAQNVFAQKMGPAADMVFKQLDILLEEAGKAESLYNTLYQLAMVDCREKQNKCLDTLNKTTELNIRIADEAKVSAAQDLRLAGITSVGGMAVGFAVALVLGVLLSLSITRPLQRIITGLSESGEQVAAASGEVASASQSLAEGTSEQAAAIEQSSSSLEEISSMTRQNAENAAKANSLVAETAKIMGETKGSMNDLIRSMSEISRSSEETQKIIKTIDEIAFQTNLLALNAAVEAARAGEAGAGFAVVADEVRNLAMRAAEAAKNTAHLIDGSVKQIHEGSAIVAKTDEAFKKVAQSAQQVNELVSEIAAASQEQAQGIEQVNRGVSEMDKVTQQNAANAEESASAAEQMSAQAAQMKGFVDQLVAVVGGGAGDGGESDKQASVRAAAPAPTARAGRPRVPAPATGGLARKRTLGSRAAEPAEVRPEQQIPFDDEGFKNF